MFHEHETIANMEKKMGCAKLTYDGVVNLTLGQTPSKSAIDGAETPESK